jgi:hypothetical protein
MFRKRTVFFLSALLAFCLICCGAGAWTDRLEVRLSVETGHFKAAAVPAESDAPDIAGGLVDTGDAGNTAAPAESEAPPEPAGAIAAAEPAVTAAPAEAGGQEAETEKAGMDIPNGTIRSAPTE